MLPSKETPWLTFLAGKKITQNVSEFDNKLQSLKDIWNEKETKASTSERSKLSFHDWITKEKVS